MTDEERYQLLYDQSVGTFRPGEVGGMRTKRIVAGTSLEVESYPVLKWNREVRRRAKEKETKPAQARINRANIEKKIRRYLEANFDERDLFLTLTYDYGFVDSGMTSYAECLEAYESGRYPRDDDEARRDLKNFLKRIKRLLDRIGGELKYLYCIATTREPKEDDPLPLPPHYHFHLVISAPGLTREQIEAKWPHGRVNARPLDFRGSGMESLAKYMVRNAKGEIGADGRVSYARKWAKSQNLKEPKVTVADHKISSTRAMRIAQDVQGFGKEIFEKLYPGYAVLEIQVRYSDIVAGAYIYARLRRKDVTGHDRNKQRQGEVVRGSRHRPR